MRHRHLTRRPQHRSRPGDAHRRSLVAALTGLLLLVGSVAVLGAPPASAGPVDGGWAAAGTGATTTVSDGSQSAAQMTYDADNTPGSSGSWTFTTTATTSSAAGSIEVPYTWQGLHAWFQVTTRLEMVVDGQVVGAPLVAQGPTSCCTSPSNGFLYGGVATFDVAAGQTYGFRLSGSNNDSNNFLRGTFTLSTRPYLDASIGTDNRDWPGAEELPSGGLDAKLVEAGEARWFKFPVIPGQQATVDLTNLPKDYDVALYGDIQQAFDQLSQSSGTAQLASTAAAGAPGSQTQVPSYEPELTTIATKENPPAVTQQFAPRVYAPRVYAPRVYAPRVYAPRVYAPRVYAPRVYAGDSFLPELASDENFRNAFSTAQNQTLLAVSANTGTQSETVAASTGNTDGDYYVRVQGHTDAAFDSDRAFSLTRTLSGSTACEGVHDQGTAPAAAPAAPGRDTTLIVTDTNKLDLTGDRRDSYLASLDSLAARTGGTVLDTHGSSRVVALQVQLAAHPGCPYAANLVASAIKQAVDAHRTGSTTYVVIAGGDEVIPFFRYPDTSGLGQESQFVPPVLPDSPSGASLEQDQVQSQDAYGSSAEVTIGGTSLPVPDLAVGRLVKSPDQIESTITNYLALQGGDLPAPSSSLVTGYDFLADAAHAVHGEFQDAVGGSQNDELITEPSTPLDEAWTATDLAEKLLGTRHDLVYLAGHFSANDTLAADFDTTFDADELDPEYDGGANAEKLKNTIVLSAGCHSGYNIVDGAAVPGRTNPNDWTQRMAEQHAVLIGGTGYQYGDSDFLEYSERLYLQVARRLHEGTTGGSNPAIAVGRALSLAKQDYLATLGTVTGLDQKAVLEATLYGLPMTGFDAPGRTPLGTVASGLAPSAVTSGPGAELGLSTAGLDVSPRAGASSLSTRDSKDSYAAAPLPGTLSWRHGADGVAVAPGAPALPKQVEDVTVAGKTLRGVGFRSGRYDDTSGLLPLTGAPAIEGNTPNGLFESDAFFPQRLARPNYFGALGSSGRTSLVVTPAQYRSDSGGAATNTERAYSALGLRLFYSGDQTATYGQNRPALSAPPSIGGVQGTVTGSTVTFSTTVTGDPSAGVQQVWVTWTGTGSDSGHGEWRSVDLTQDPADSTRWIGTLSLPAGQSASGIRFLVQAANGIGAVGLDTAEGDGYRVTAAGVPDTAVVALRAQAPSAASPLGVTARVDDGQGAPAEGRTVAFTVSRAGQALFTYYDSSDATGVVGLGLPSGQQLPSGRLAVKAELLDESGGVRSTDSVETVVAGVRITTSPDSLSAPAGTALPGPVTATLADARGPVSGVPVTFELPATGPRATFPGVGSTATVVTGADGRAVAPATGAMVAAPTPGIFTVSISAEGAGPTTVPVAAQYVLNPLQRAVAGTRLDLQTMAALAKAERVQVRWRLATAGSPWIGARTDFSRWGLAEFLAQRPRPATLGLVRGKTYLVMVRVLPAPGDPRPTGDTDRDGTFDLGSLSFTVRAR